MIPWMEYLKQAVDSHASDIFFVAGGPVCLKQEGHLHRLDTPKLMPADTQQIAEEIYASAKRSMASFSQSGDDDFSFSIPTLARFRVNTYRQRGSIAVVIRLVSFDIPDWEAIGIVPLVMEIADLESGMVLVTGTAGSGKSTTQACIKIGRAHV